MFSGVVAIRRPQPPRSGKLFVLLGAKHNTRSVRPFRIVGGPGAGGTMFLGVGGV